MQKLSKSKLFDLQKGSLLYFCVHVRLYGLGSAGNGTLKTMLKPNMDIGSILEKHKSTQGPTTTENSRTDMSCGRDPSELKKFRFYKPWHDKIKLEKCEA